MFEWIAGMFRGKVKGRKGNDQGGSGGKKQGMLLISKSVETTLEQTGELCCLTTQKGNPATLLRRFSYLYSALVIGFLCVLQGESHFM